MRAPSLLILAAAMNGSSSDSWAAEQRGAKLVTSVPPAVGQPALVSSDPLMNLIRRRQISEPNGGVESYAAPRSGPSIKLEPADEAGSTEMSLPVHPELKPRERQPPVKKRTPPMAAKQLETLKKQGDAQNWGDGVKTKLEPAAPPLKTEIQ